jgi:hypothetical protein
LYRRFWPADGKVSEFADAALGGFNFTVYLIGGLKVPILMEELKVFEQGLNEWGPMPHMTTRLPSKKVLTY